MTAFMLNIQSKFEGLQHQLKLVTGILNTRKTVTGM